MKGRWMAAMTFFVVALYSFFFISGALSLKDKDPERAREQAQVIEALKQKEEVARENLESRPELLAALSLVFLGALGAGIALDATLIARRSRGRSWPVRPLPAADAAWSGRDVFQAFIFLLFVEACLFFGQSLFLLLAGFKGEMPDSFLLLSSLLRNLAVTGFVWVLVKRRYRQGAQELGLRFQEWAAHLRTGAVGYVAALPPLLLTFILLSVVMKWFSLEPSPQNVVQIYLKESTESYLIPLTLFVAVLGPVMEEVFFRGFAYRGLRARFGIWGGACFSSALFASLHMNGPAFVPIFMLGLFLTALYEISGSLVPSITAHVLHNTIMVALTLGFKGLSS